MVEFYGDRFIIDFARREEMRGAAAFSGRK
jgi:hypothetical protein